MIETYDNTLQTILDNLNIVHTVSGELLDLHFNESITPGLLRAFFEKYERTLYNFIADMLERVYDVRMVWPSEDGRV